MFLRSSLSCTVAVVELNGKSPQIMGVWEMSELWIVLVSFKASLLYQSELFSFVILTREIFWGVRNLFSFFYPLAALQEVLSVFPLIFARPCKKTASIKQIPGN